jgi:hypothetical protein
MKILLVFLFSLPLFAFQTETIYQCNSLYRLISDDNSHQELSKDEQLKSQFELIISKDSKSIQSSEGMLYRAKSSSDLFVNQVQFNGKTLYFKIQLSKDSLYKSVYALGYGNLIHEYVVCKRKDR